MKRQPTIELTTSRHARRRRTTATTALIQLVRQSYGGVWHEEKCSLNPAGAGLRARQTFCATRRLPLWVWRMKRNSISC